MIDTLVDLLPRAEARWPVLRCQWPLESRFILVTLHRPSNVDDPAVLREILMGLNILARGGHAVLFPVHPRTRQRIDSISGLCLHRNLLLADPVGYLDFLSLEKHAALVITDSGGIQEETTFLDIPCLTVRENTERPITITMGTNTLVTAQQDQIAVSAQQKLDAVKLSRCVPPLWDGQTSRRIAEAFRRLSEA
jgi:UDP-N-acetylglucosamine 2-epimerase (non-hydrolysing)